MGLYDTTKYDQICHKLSLLLPRTFVDLSTKVPIIVPRTHIIAISMKHNLSWLLPRTYTVQKMGKKIFSTNFRGYIHELTWIYPRKQLGTIYQIYQYRGYIHQICVDIATIFRNDEHYRGRFSICVELASM